VIFFRNEIINLNSYNRPQALQVTHIILQRCSRARILLDLENINTEFADITDVSFEEIDDLFVNFDVTGANGYSPNTNDVRYVFTNIRNLEMTGRISGDQQLQMFIRSWSRNLGSSSMDVLFRELQVQSTIHLLNIQDVRTVRVVNSKFERIDNLDVKNTAKCYLSLSYSEPASCTKTDLFYVSDFTASSLTDDDLTHSPLFIVGMVLIAAVILIAVLVVLYVRYHNRYNVQESMRCQWCCYGCNRRDATRF